MPVLNGYSELLFQHSKTWDKNIHTTGSWAIKEEPNFTPPNELIQFIENEEPPLYIGFGSMKDIHTFKTTFQLILSALNKTKQRAVVCLGWSNLNYTEPIPENIYLIESIPHSWLFPQMSIVIHHGGAGTTAAGLTAGKPTIIIPHNADQPAWGQRVYELGVGSKPIKKSKLTAAKLANAITYALNPQVVIRAEELGQKLRKENGVANAVCIINEYLHKRFS
jgi:sterol 3beta-glucosyltransferase